MTSRTMMWRRGCVGALLVVLMMGAAPNAAWAAVTVEALGSAAAGGNDAERTRRRALDDAFRQAVDQTVNTQVTPESYRGAAEVIKTRVLRRARAYVASHRVLEESDEGGVYSIKVEAVVSDDVLRKDLQALGVPLIGEVMKPGVPGPAPVPVARPKLAVVVVGVGASESVGQLVGAALRGRGWEVSTTLAREIPIDDGAAVEAARAAGAKVVLVVSLESKDGGAVRGTGLRGAEVDLLARSVDGSGAAPLRLSETRLAAAGAGIGAEGAVEAALREAAAKIVRALAPKLEDRWPATPLSQSGWTTVWARNVLRWQEPAALAKALAGVPGVERVTLLGAGRGELRWAVVGRASERALIAAVPSALGGAAQVTPGVVRVDLAAPPPTLPVAPAGQVVTP